MLKECVLYIHLIYSDIFRHIFSVILRVRVRMTDTTPIVDTTKGTTIDMISIFLAFDILLPPGEHNILLSSIVLQRQNMTY